MSVVWCDWQVSDEREIGYHAHDGRVPAWQRASLTEAPLAWRAPWARVRKRAWWPWGVGLAAACWVVAGGAWQAAESAWVRARVREWPLPSWQPWQRVHANDGDVSCLVWRAHRRRALVGVDHSMQEMQPSS